MTGEGEARVVLVRMSEHVQAEADVLADLAAAGVRPGAELTVKVSPFGYRLSVGDQVCELSPTFAEGLFVRPV